MPVRVNVPIKLRLHGGDSHVQLGEIVAATAAATQRALVKSRQVVVEPRGGYEVVRCAVPTFTWRGPTDQLSFRARRELEHALSSAIHRAIAGSGILMYEEARAKAPEVLPDEIAELFDPGRFEDDLDLYWIPTYDAKGKPNKATKLAKKGGSKAPEAGSAEIQADFPEFTSEDSQDFVNTFGWTVSEYFAGRQLPNIFGVVYRIQGVANPLLSLWERGAKSWRLYRFQLGAVRALQKTALDLTKLGNYSWSKLPSTPDALKTWRENAEKSLKRSYLENHKGTKDADKNKQLEAAAAAKAHDEVMKYTDGWEAKYPAFYAFNHGDGTTNYPVRAELLPHMPPSGFADVVPLAVAITVSDSDDPDALGKAGGRYKLAIGEIPGDVDGVVGGTGMVIAPHYNAQAPSKFAFKPGGDTQMDRMASLMAFKPVCEPYLHEPSVHTFGDKGARMWQLIQQIASILEMPPCQYAANFAINAAKVLGGRAGGIGDAITLDKAEFIADLTIGTYSETGEFSWKPVPSPAVQELRLLGSVVPLLEQLVAMLKDTLFPLSSILSIGYFYQDFNEALEGAIVWIYVFGCQIVLLQMLTASRENIEERLDPHNLASYAGMTKVLLTTVGADQVELIRLRDALKSVNDMGQLRLLDIEEPAVFGRDPDFVPVWNEFYDVDNDIRLNGSYGSLEEVQARHDRWTRAFDALEKLRARTDLRFCMQDIDHAVRGLGGDPRVGRSVQRDDQVWLIFDHYGKQWTIDELNNAIAVRQQYLEATDPILKHIKFSEDVPDLVNHPDKIQGYIEALLKDLLDKNADIRGDALGDPKYAFEHSKINKAEGATDYYGNVSGLHAMVHEMLHDAFGNAVHYPQALEDLYRYQIGWVALRDAFLFVGIIALSIACPPLGAVAGVAEAVWRYSEAKEDAELYDAVFDTPEAIISRAEVEAQMFVAKLGLALSFIPVVTDIVAPASKIIKGIATRALTEGAGEAAERLLVKYLETLAEELAKKLGPGLIKELAVMAVLQEVIGKMIDPFVEDAIRQVDASISVKLPEAEQRLVDARDPSDNDERDPRDEDFVDVEDEQ